MAEPAPELAEYERGPVLGAGGFGSVHAATELRSGEPVAIKVVDKAKMAAAGITGRIMNEVRLHSQLSHPAVVKLLPNLHANSPSTEGKCAPSTDTIVPGLVDGAIQAG